MFRFNRSDIRQQMTEKKVNHPAPAALTGWERFRAIFDPSILENWQKKQRVYDAFQTLMKQDQSLSDANPDVTGKQEDMEMSLLSHAENGTADSDENTEAAAILLDLYAYDKADSDAQPPSQDSDRGFSQTGFDIFQKPLIDECDAYVKTRMELDKHSMCVEKNISLTEEQFSEDSALMKQLNSQWLNEVKEKLGLADLENVYIEINKIIAPYLEAEEGKSTGRWGRFLRVMTRGKYGRDEARFQALTALDSSCKAYNSWSRHNGRGTTCHKTFCDQQLVFFSMDWLRIRDYLRCNFIELAYHLHVVASLLDSQKDIQKLNTLKMDLLNRLFNLPPVPEGYDELPTLKKTYARQDYIRKLQTQQVQLENEIEKANAIKDSSKNYRNQKDELERKIAEHKQAMQQGLKLVAKTQLMQDISQTLTSFTQTNTQQSNHERLSKAFEALKETDPGGFSMQEERDIKGLERRIGESIKKLEGIEESKGYGRGQKLAQLQAQEKALQGKRAQAERDQHFRDAASVAVYGRVIR